MNTSVTHPYQNHHLPLELRVKDLISRFTIEEKINLMCQYQDQIERLGVKPYKHGTEAAHGMAWLGEATTFPQSIGLACTWDTELLQQVGSAIGDEARGFYKKDPTTNGLTLWAPTVDMERDPRWGRTEEAYGEDPHLTGKLASALIQGIQGSDPFYLKAVASLKHFIGNNNEINRGECSVSIDPRNMHEYYLKAFEMPFKEGGALSMMTSYNSINGVPANLNPDVLKIVKQQWGMNGFIVSDAGDVLGTVNDHHYYDNYTLAVANSILSGIDSITDDHDISKQAIRDALSEGLLTEQDLDHALCNTFRVRFRLGEFDPVENNPYSSIPESIICSGEHIKLSLQAAHKNTVLLKNEHQALPLNPKKVKQIAVIGPLANRVYRDWYSGSLPYAITPLKGITEKLSEATVVFREGSDQFKLKSTTTGQYVRLSGKDNLTLIADAKNSENAEVFHQSDWGWDCHTLISTTNGKYITTDDIQLTASSDEIWGWFTKEVFHIHEQDDHTIWLKTWNQHSISLSDSDDGVLTVVENKDDSAAEKFEKEYVVDGLLEAINAAKTADTVIVFVGNHPLINGKETIDRPDITLPHSQEQLIQEVYRANPNTIVVIVGSYPYAINWVNEHIPAIVYTSHAGQELGHAVANVLFGDYAPAGRLNMTWYRSVDQLPDIMDYDIIKGGRTYQYFEGDVLYPFGHGLTYPDFLYEDVQVSANEIEADGLVTISFLVTNLGSGPSDEVAQLYVHQDQSRVKRPLKQLMGFQRFHLHEGQSETISFTLSASELSLWDVTREQFCVESGCYSLMIGRSSRDIQLNAKLIVHGEEIPPRDLFKRTSSINYDDYEGVQLGKGVEGESCIFVTNNHAWINFSDVNLNDEVHAFEACVASIEGGSIEIRLGSLDSPIIGICIVPPTGGSQIWHTAQCNISTLKNGNHEVYLKMNGPISLSHFLFM